MKGARSLSWRSGSKGRAGKPAGETRLSDVWFENGIDHINPFLR